MNSLTAVKDRLPFMARGSNAFSGGVGRQIAAVEIALTCGIAVVAAYIVWALMAPVSTDVDAPSRALVSTQNPLVDVSILDRFVYFSASPSKAEPQTLASRDTAAPETNLDIQLFGVRTADPETGRSGSAIIRTPEGRQQAFQVGQTVTDGVTLDQVLSDRVVLSRGGIRESLYLDPNGPRRGGAATTATRQVSLSGLSPVDLLQRFQLRPQMDNRRINGFVIGAVSGDGGMQGLGIQPGDIVMEVNGNRLTSFERVAELPEELKGASELRLKLVRDGRPVEQTITLTP